MMKKIMILLVLVMSVFMFSSCDGKERYHLKLKVIPSEYMNTVIYEIDYYRAIDELITIDDFLRPFRNICGDNSMYQGYNLYYNSLDKKITFPDGGYIDEDCTIYITYLKTSPNLDSEEFGSFEDICAKRDYVVTYYKEYENEYKGKKYQYQNVLVLKDINNMLYIKELDNDYITESDVLSFFKDAFIHFYFQTQIIPLHTEPTILDGPYYYDQYDSEYEAHILTDYDGTNYTISQIKNYEAPHERIDDKVILDSNIDKLYFQIFPTYLDASN